MIVWSLNRLQSAQRRFFTQIRLFIKLSFPSWQSLYAIIANIRHQTMSIPILSVNETINTVNQFYWTSQWKKRDKNRDEPQWENAIYIKRISNDSYTRRDKKLNRLLRYGALDTHIHEFYLFLPRYNMCCVCAWNWILWIKIKDRTRILKNVYSKRRKVKKR